MGPRNEKTVVASVCVSYASGTVLVAFLTFSQILEERYKIGGVNEAAQPEHGASKC